MTAPAIRIVEAPESLRAGLAALRQYLDALPAPVSGPWEISFAHVAALAPHSFEIQTRDRTIAIRYSDRSAAFRALGRVPALTPEAARMPTTICETSPFTMRGLMIDCSRNGVMRVEALQEFLRRVALMGVNMLMLYTEDTYEIPGEPFFGHLRGAYTARELREIDDYADALGIEIIPCIQTLGHMEQALKWPCYAHLQDVPRVLLAEHEDTYAFIEKMIRAASAPVRSRRIHIGMDEAFGIGTGRYRELHGEVDRFAIMNRHLARVRDLCAAQGLRPMIWSDMYFRLGSKRHLYSADDWTIPEDAIRSIPGSVELVYWDYYSDDPEHYRRMIECHRRLGSDPIMAGGIWTWQYFWTALPWSLNAVKACMTACRQEGLGEVFMTLWGDDGMEVDIFSSLPAIQYFCEHAFGAADPLQQARRNFDAATGTAFDAWTDASGIDFIPLLRGLSSPRHNTSKGLVWEDPLLSIYGHFDTGDDLREHYRGLAERLSRQAAGAGLAHRLAFPAAIARALAVKAGLRRRLHEAYAAGDREKLRALHDGPVAETITAVRALWKRHRAVWMDTYKPFGWEVIENRYGGLIARLETLSDRLRDYLDGTLDEIPELGVEILDPHPPPHLPRYTDCASVKTISTIRV